MITATARDGYIELPGRNRFSPIHTFECGNASAGDHSRTAATSALPWAGRHAFGKRAADFAFPATPGNTSGFGARILTSTETTTRLTA